MAAYRSSDQRDEALIRRVLSRRHMLELALAGSAGLALVGRRRSRYQRSPSRRHRTGRLGPGGGGARGLPHAGEPLLRPLLRHLPGRARVRRPPGRRQRGVRPAGAGRLPDGRRSSRSISTWPRAIGELHPRPHPQLGSPAPVLGPRHDGRLREGPHHGPSTRGPSTARYHGLLPPHRRPLPLRAGRRLHPVRRLSLLGDGAHPPQPADGVSGTLDPAGLHGGPVLITNPSPSAKFSVDWPTMPEVLEDAGVSWKVYNPPGAPLRHRMPGRWPSPTR